MADATAIFNRVVQKIDPTIRMDTDTGKCTFNLLSACVIAEGLKDIASSLDKVATALDNLTKAEAEFNAKP